MSTFADVRELETELHRTATRRDPARLRELLHEDFIEIGRSGTRWTRDPLIESLLAAPESPGPQTDEWEFSELPGASILVTYRITRGTAVSRHSSLWDLSGARPVLRFHQGTVVPDPS